MRPCPQCGTPAPDTAGRCPACGTAFPPVLERTQPGHMAPDLGGTLPLKPPAPLGRPQTGHAAPTAAPPSAPQPPRLTGPAALKATVLGLTPSTPPPAP